MKILGIHIGHESGAALLVDGTVVADVSEERFTRVKHYAGLPIASVNYCLQQGGISSEDIDVVAVATKRGVPELNILFNLEGARAERPSAKERFIDVLATLNRSKRIVPPLYLKSYHLSPDTKIQHVEHHLAHAASAYYTSGLKGRCVIVTCDGYGDGLSLAIWRGENGRIDPLKKFPRTASIGWFYSNVTEALGWWHGDGEGKTMGLAPYGEPGRVDNCLEPFYPKFSGGDLVEAHDFGPPGVWNDNGALQFHLEESAVIQTLLDRYSRENIAAEAQQILEDQMVELIYPWMERENTRQLCCSGGVFLNVKLNQRLWYEGRITEQWICPNPGDAGLALGAALHVDHAYHPDRPIKRQLHPYHGPSYDDPTIETLLKDRHLPVERVGEPAAAAAEALAEDRIVAWFQGRMEAGPRALGNRSILMSARRPENKDIINARVKFREPFRPFCPSILDEYRDDYLVNPRSEPFMITSFDAAASKRSLLPAVIHEDGTFRPQTVERHINPAYHELIRAFGDITGEYALLNTSFNILGEPIICHPHEAIRCFFDSGIDVLIMGSYVLQKNGSGKNCIK